jgi:hypothetical protein
MFRPWHHKPSYATDCSNGKSLVLQVYECSMPSRLSESFEFPVLYQQLLCRTAGTERFFMMHVLNTSPARRAVRNPDSVS